MKTKFDKRISEAYLAFEKLKRLRNSFDGIRLSIQKAENKDFLWCGRAGDNTYPRSMFVGRCVEEGIRICQIADYMNRSSGTVQHFLAIHKAMILNNYEYRKLYESFFDSLTKITDIQNKQSNNELQY